MLPAGLPIRIDWVEGLLEWQGASSGKAVPLETVPTEERLSPEAPLVEVCLGLCWKLEPLLKWARTPQVRYFLSSSKTHLTVRSQAAEAEHP